MKHTVPTMLRAALKFSVDLIETLVLIANTQDSKSEPQRLFYPRAK
jgi:hypothetical protein